MNRFATRYWLQDWPLSVQLWACLSLAEGLTLAAILLYVLLLLRPEEPGQWYGLAALFPLLLIANLFAAKLAARRITEPLERLAGNLERIKGKNWSEPVLQVARRDEIGTGIINHLFLLLAKTNKKKCPKSKKSRVTHHLYYIRVKIGTLTFTHSILLTE